MIRPLVCEVIVDPPGNDQPGAVLVGVVLHGPLEGDPAEVGCVSLYGGGAFGRVVCCGGGVIAPGLGDAG